MRRPPAPLAVLVAPVPAVFVLVLALVFALAACTTPSPGEPLPPATTATATGIGTPPPTTTTEDRPPLVVETDFDQTSLDPATLVESNLRFVAGAVYQTLTTIDPADRRTVRPGLAEWTVSPEGTWLTLRVRPGAKFSDGTPVTSDDVVFSLVRARGAGGPAAALLGSVQARAVDDRTLTLTSSQANFALPKILSNPALGILNADVVRSHQGTVGSPAAGDWLTTHSAGSGPYVIAAAEPGKSVTLEPNEHWTGARPAFPDVIVRDATPAEQVDHIQSGAADVVLDVPPSDADAVDLRPTVATVAITSQTSSSVTYLMLNRSSAVNPWTSDRDFADAVRLGLDLSAITDLAGPGAQPALGLVPPGVLGAFQQPAPEPTPTAAPTGASTAGSTGTPGGTPSPPAVAPRTQPNDPSDGPLIRPAPPTEPSTPTPLAPTTPAPTGTNAPIPTATPTAPPARDLRAAKAALVRAGYQGAPVRLSFASDLPIHGLDPARVAEAVRTQLRQVGIRVTLAPAPRAAALAAYESGRSAMGLWTWTPEYPDPEASLTFAPGGNLGLRANWLQGLDQGIDGVTRAARSAFGDERPGSYARWQLQMNSSSPFIPLFVPGRHHAHGDRVTDLPASPVMELDLARVR